MHAALARLATRLKPQPTSLPSAGELELADDQQLLALAKQMVRLRRRRDAAFGELFGEPAWDMLLDLYIARCEDREVGVSSACIGSAVAATTALRWLTNMADAGFIQRTRDPTDLRRVFVKLTDSAFSKMHCLLREAAADRRRAQGLPS